MSCEPKEGEVFQCGLCDTQFEREVSDPGPNGEPRCPQCGLVDARPITPDELGDFVVRHSTKFR